MTPRIDAHQHFWRYQTEEYRWIDASMAPLQRDFMPPQLAKERAALGIDGSVLVQARQSQQETQWLLELSADDPAIAAVVGWIDLAAGELPHELEKLAMQPKLRGFRHQIQDESDPAGWMQQVAIGRGMQQIQRQGYVYDLLVTHRQLAAAHRFAARHDNHWLVLDHFGKPDLSAGVSAWVAAVAPLAAMPHVCCKLSGLLTEPQPDGGNLIDYYSAALELFGSERLMFGSDWPVCLLNGGYHHGWQLCQRAIVDLPAGQQAAILGANACRIYLNEGVQQ